MCHQSPPAGCVRRPVRPSLLQPPAHVPRRVPDEASVELAQEGKASQSCEVAPPFQRLVTLPVLFSHECANPQFEMFRNQLVNISQSPFLPVSAEFEHEPAQTEPPIGANLMMHLFENPGHIDIFPVLFKRIPRKTKERLEACHVWGSSVGWGVQYVEALNGLYVFLFGYLGFLVCLGISVAWMVVKHDIQGGFAIGGFVLAFVLFCCGMLHSHAA